MQCVVGSFLYVVSCQTGMTLHKENLMMYYSVLQNIRSRLKQNILMSYYE